ncbi:MAG: hypothetical protein ACTTH5_08520 [Wolinella sp.]
MTIDEFTTEMQEHGKFTKRDQKMVARWLLTIPKGELESFYEALIADKFELNPSRNGQLNVRLIYTYISTWLQNSAQARAGVLFNAYLRGEKIPYFSDEELSDIEFLGIGEGFKAQIASRIYKELERGVL